MTVWRTAARKKAQASVVWRRDQVNGARKQLAESRAALAKAQADLKAAQKGAK
jgi:hypothetical protein